MTRHILIVNGPNLNMLGQREPGIYGAQTLDEVNQSLNAQASNLGLELTFVQSNSEGELVTLIQQASDNYDGLIINPGAYSHTSIAIPDALRLFTGPIVEVHLSNIHARERFRHHSYVSAVATGVICGLGAQGYMLALHAIAQQNKS